MLYFDLYDKHAHFKIKIIELCYNIASYFPFDTDVWLWFASMLMIAIQFPVAFYLHIKDTVWQ